MDNAEDKFATTSNDHGGEEFGPPRSLEEAADADANAVTSDLEAPMQDIVVGSGNGTEDPIHGFLSMPADVHQAMPQKEQPA